MTKEELAVAATFLVAGLRKEIAGSEHGEIYADYTLLCLRLEDAELNNRPDTGSSITEKSKRGLALINNRSRWVTSAAEYANTDPLTFQICKKT